MANSLTDGLELSSTIASRFAPPSRSQGLTHPFGDGQLVSTRGLLNIPQLSVVEENLKALTHMMSLEGFAG